MLRKILALMKGKNAAPEKIIRRKPRLSFPFSVLVGEDEPPAQESLLINMSDEGVAIKSAKVFQQGTKIHLVIETDDKNYKAEGEVVWTKHFTPALMNLLKTGMGIRFTHLDNELKDIYDGKNGDEGGGGADKK